MRLSGVLALFALAACGSTPSCPRGSEMRPNGVCVEQAHGDDDDDDDRGDDDDDDDGDDDDDQEPGAKVGDTCSDDSDCESGGLFCVFEDGSDSVGICTESCTSWADCSEAFWGCCDIGYGGSACIPDDWIERAGIECN
jgi:hypothetical protein